MGYGSGYAPTRATIITDQAEHTAKFVKLLALEDSVVHTLTAESIDENLATGNATAFPLGKNCCIEGLVMSKVKLTSGTVLAYIA
jgi:hypothetical protein